MKLKAVFLLAPPITWYALTLRAPGWPIKYVAAGMIVAALAAAIFYGGEPREAWVAAPAALAVAASGVWVGLHYVTEPPVSWLRYGGLAVAGVWIAGAAWWLHLRGGPTVKQGRKKSRDPLRAALAATGLPRLNTPAEGEPDAVKISKPRTEGAGHTYTVTLPDGVAVDELITRQPRLAGTLKRRTADVTIEVGDTEAEAVIWVGAKGAGALQAGPWPHVDNLTGRSCFEPISIGVDKRGKPVTVTLHGGSGVLIGSQPGFGKSALMNLLVASILTDRRARASFIDCKGLDFPRWRAASERFYAGSPSNHPEEVLAILEEFRADMEAKFDSLPERRVTKIGDTLASLPGMHPTLLVIDEAHELFGASSGMSRDDRAKAVDILKSIFSRGRAVNAWVILASQRVTDDEIPAKITQLVTTRVAFHLGSQPASQAVLGPDAWAQGYRATLLQAPGVGLIASDLGVGHVRTWFLDDAATFRVIDRIVQERSQAPAGSSGGTVEHHRQWSVPAASAPLSVSDTEVLRAVESGRPPAGWRISEVQEEGAREAVREAEDELCRLEQEHLAARSERGDAASEARAGVVNDLLEVWPYPRNSASWEQLADLLGVDVYDLREEARDASIPSKRVSVDGRKCYGCHLEDVESRR